MAEKPVRPPVPGAIDNFYKTRFIRWVSLAKALPSVVGDSQTHDELLRRVLEAVNEMISDVAVLKDAWEEYSEWLIENINNLWDWFDNLDIQAEVDRKIDELVADGTLASLINETLLASINAKVDLLNERLDNLVIEAGNTDAEVMDARVAFNGVNYNLLGTHIRTITSELYNYTQDSRSSYFFNIAHRIRVIEDQLDMQFNTDQGFNQGRWLLGQTPDSTIDKSQLAWFSSKALEFSSGDEIFFKAGYNVEVVVFTDNVVTSKISSTNISPIVINNDGLYAISVYIDGAGNITPAIIEQAKQDIIFASYNSVRLDELENAIDSLNNTLDMRKGVENMNFKIGRWLLGGDRLNGINAGATQWFSSGVYRIEEGDMYTFPSNYYCELNIFNEATLRCESKVSATNVSPIVIDKTGYYALSIYLYGAPQITDADIEEANENVKTVLSYSRRLEELESRIDYTIDPIDVDFMPNRISSDNDRWFHTSQFSSNLGIRLIFTDGFYEASSLRALNMNTGEYTTDLYSGIVLRNGTYVIEGYAVPVREMTEEELALIKEDFLIQSYGRKASISSDGSIYQQYASFVPYWNGNTQENEPKALRNYRNSVMPFFGTEYLQHWYEKVYENQSCVITTEGDSITQGYNPNYPGVNDTFIGQRQYHIENIMKSGGYDMSKLTVFNNGFGGQTTNEWVCNPTYAKPEYQTNWPNGLVQRGMDQNPDLMIIAWGTNDGDNRSDIIGSGILNTQERLDLFEKNLRNGLTRIRTNERVDNKNAYNKGVDDLSIILMSTINTGLATDGRTFDMWGQYTWEIIQNLCRSFQCAFYDLNFTSYANLDMDPKVWSPLTSTGGRDGIHITKYADAQNMAMLADLIYPRTMWNNI